MACPALHYVTSLGCPVGGGGGVYLAHASHNSVRMIGQEVRVSVPKHQTQNYKTETGLFGPKIFCLNLV